MSVQSSGDRDIGASLFEATLKGLHPDKDDLSPGPLSPKGFQ